MSTQATQIEVPETCKDAGYPAPVSLSFIGPKINLTSAQRLAVASVLQRLNPKEVIHGCHAHADMEFHWIARNMFSNSVTIHLRPSFATAYIPPDGVVYPRDFPMVRNRDGIKQGNMLVVCLEKPIHKVTALLIKFAKHLDRKIIYIHPDGKIDGAVQ